MRKYYRTLRILVIITIFSFTLLFGDKLHRASYCHNKLLHLILLPSAPLPSLWPKSPESEQGVQDSIHWQPCFLQVQTGHSVSSAMRARYKSVWTDARTDSSLTSLTCTLYYTATTFMSVSVICTSMEDGMFLSEGVAVVQWWKLSLQYFLLPSCFGDKLHRASYCHNKLLSPYTPSICPTAQFVTKSP